MKNTNVKRRFAEAFLAIIIIGVLIVIPMISAVGISSDYNNDNPATIGPGETKVIDIMRLLSSTADINNGSVKYKAELLDGAGVATLVGNGDYSVLPTSPAIVQVKVTAPADAALGTQYLLSFKFTDVTPSTDSGMISFTKSSSVTTPIIVKTSAPQAAPIEKPNNGSMAWVIIVVALIVIIAIVAYLFLAKKKVSGKAK